MSKNINSITIITTLEGIEKTKIEKNDNNKKNNKFSLNESTQYISEAG